MRAVQLQQPSKSHALVHIHKSVVEKWLVFPPVTRKTRVQFPAAEFEHAEKCGCTRCRRGWRHKCTDSRRGELKLRLGHAPATAVRGPASQMVLLEPRTLRLLAVRSNQLSCETDAPVYTPQDKTRAAGQLQPRSGEHLQSCSEACCAETADAASAANSHCCPGPSNTQAPSRACTKRRAASRTTHLRQTTGATNEAGKAPPRTAPAEHRLCAGQACRQECQLWGSWILSPPP